MFKKMSTASTNRPPILVPGSAHVLGYSLSRKPEVRLSRLQRAELERLDRYGRFGRK
ncbi:MAG TPA: hypothetical protein VJ654_00140 [Noviherbaspirillum sp.]|nr:hypothetical protein [Noviherbaspirillum sp.]